MGKKVKLPFYFTESLPDKKQMKTKQMIARIPDSVERPSAEMMNKNLTQLFKEEQARVARIQKRKQNRLLKEKKRLLKKASQSINPNASKKSLQVQSEKLLREQEEYIDLFTD